MKIRFAKEKDAKKISKVYEEWKKLKEVLPSDLIKPETPAEIKSEISNSTKKYIVAEINKQIVGVCYIELSFIALKTLRLGNMIIKEEYRRKGVASSLISFIKSFAKENSMKKIWLWTQEELKNAIKLYEKNGFKLEGRQESQFCGKDALLYGLVL